MTDEERRRAAANARNKRYRLKHKAKCQAYATAYRLAHKKPRAPMPASKVCASCLIDKPREAFYPDRRATGQRPTRGGLGVAARCKECQSHRRKPTLQGERAMRVKLNAAGLKTCGACDVAKPRSAFPVRRASADGLSFTCRSCANARSKNWKLLHPGAHADWYRNNQERKAKYWAAWYQQHKASRAETHAKWTRANNGRRRAISAKRMAAKYHATPAWADLDAIRAIYVESARLTKDTGIMHHVDHIYPLQGETVCGLHVACNLQILTSVENIRKRNKFPLTPHKAPPRSPSAEARR